MRCSWFLAVFFSLCGCFSGLVASASCIVESDICIYGGTSGGVAAAVAAARLGKSTTLILLNSHVGGMSSGGLGVTDRGNTASIGGISREFYSRVGQHYNSSSPVYFFEPHIAEQTFWEMLAGAGVAVHTNQLLSAVTTNALRITEIAMQDGTIYRAKMFIDTTYEGDLIAKAGVSFTVGREGTNAYNESLAGIHAPGGSYSYDPYIVAGNPASGLLPFVQPGAAGTVGQPDNKLQCYNFRLCLTQNPTNQIPIVPPANYSESQYELMRRYLAAWVAADTTVQLNQIIDVQTIIPNGKTDINANGELSTDYVGANYTWPTNSYAERAVVRQAHEDYIRGMLYYFATSTNVPLNVRTQMQSWQLAKDEFKDSGGWPHQIYVREARRMVSDYVMTQQDSLGQRSATDAVALASYTIDSHPVQRLAVSGLSRWEGSLGSAVPFPYPISYRSIIPKVGQCQNVFCTFALSASHVAFASCRMEPVFMMTSQSAATAAALAIDDNVAVQQLNYAKLSAQLRADGQILSWTSNSASTNGIILDQGGPGTSNSGGWANGANAGGWNGDYWHDGNTAKGSRWVKYTPTLPTNGTYEVYGWWVTDPNRATNTPFDIAHAAGTTRVLENQQQNTAQWVLLLTTNFNAGTASSVTIRNDNTTGYVIADAVRFFPVGAISNSLPTTPPAIEIVASDPNAREFGNKPGRFSLVRNGDTNGTVTVNYNVTGTAASGLDFVPLPAAVTFAPGLVVSNLLVTPITDNLVEGDETVTLTLRSSTNYTLTTVSNATVTIHDLPMDTWRLANFTAGELSDASISGDLADPNHDGFSNLMDYAMGISPKDPSTTNRPVVQLQGDFLLLTYTVAKAAVDVPVKLEQSADLAIWQPADANLQPVSCEDLGTATRLTVRFTAPVSSAGRQFLRFRATRLTNP
jgi:hypothetical protein